MAAAQDWADNDLINSTTWKVTEQSNSIRTFMVLNIHQLIDTKAQLTTKSSIFEKYINKIVK